MDQIWLAFFVALGILEVVFFHFGYYQPVWVSVIVFVLVSYLLVRLYQHRRVGFLILLFYLIYALPFIHIIPYLWFDYSLQPSTLWGLAANPYMTDKTTIELMAMIGAAGACGLASGATASAKRFYLPAAVSSGWTSAAGMRSLSILGYSLLTGVALIFSWLYAPAETLFTARYTEAVAISQNWNFSSIWMFSYVFLIFAAADVICERDRRVAQVKRMMMLVALFVVVVWFQLLRGDRESLTLVLAVMCMFYVWGPSIASRNSKINYTNNAMKTLGKMKKWKVIFIASSVAGISMVVGAIRHNLVGADAAMAVSTLIELIESRAIGIDGLLHGTWSAVLLTPLSIAGDYLSGNVSFQWGQTYLDLGASLIPGFVADLFGYQRPIDGQHGPAWEVTYGIGGTHAVVVPFLNFGMVGVLLIIATWSYFFSVLERRFSKAEPSRGLAFLGSVAMAAPHWLWYGEKAIINVLIIWWLIDRASRIRVKVRSMAAPSVCN